MSKRSPGANGPEADIVLVDEAQGLYREIFRAWMADCPDIPFVGLSATPVTRGSVSTTMI